jgi:uncharacterized protein
LIRPEALDALRDSDLIIHCGDVGGPAVLDALRALAPVRAIRGNNDRVRGLAAFPHSMSSRSAVTLYTFFITSQNLISIRPPRASPP